MNNHMKKTFIIAELSANHNNNFDTAVETIKAMAESGADAVKVQTYTADSLALDVDNEFFGPKKEGLWKGIRSYDLYKEAAMPYDWQPKLQKIATDLGMVFFSSPFDFKGVDFLEKIDIPIYKIASFEITDIPLIKYVAEKGKPIIISTGVATEKDIALAVDTCLKAGNTNITLLKCTSHYPSTLEEANLLTIPDIAKKFKVKVGVSDHTMGYIVPMVAVSLGAKVVEKHFILDRSLGGPDSSFSMEPSEFKEMVNQIRNVEKTLGKISYDVDKKDRAKRRSLFAVQDIEKGEVFTAQNIRSLRPGIGLAPRYYPLILGKKALLDISKGSPLEKDYFGN